MTSNQVVGIVIAVIALVSALLGLSALGSTVRSKQRRRRQRRVLHIKKANCGVSVKTLQSRTHAFGEGEDTIRWAYRDDFMEVAFLVLVPGVLAAIFLIAAPVLWAHASVDITSNGGLGKLIFGSNYHPEHPGKPTTIHVPLKLIAVFLVPLGLLLAFYAWNKVLRWRAFVTIVTNKNERRDFQAWAWAWWLWDDEEHDFQPLDTIVSAEPKSRGIGSIPVFDYGTVHVVTRVQSGESTKNSPHALKYMPRHEDCAHEIMDAKGDLEKAEKRDEIESGRRMEEDLSEIRGTLGAIHETLKEKYPEDDWGTVNP